MLGTFAGNVAMTLGARGGVYLGGGVLPRIVDRVLASDFRRRFTATPDIDRLPVRHLHRADRGPPAALAAARRAWLSGALSIGYNQICRHDLE